MDADIVRDVEFGRKMRGYDMGEVDAFLEKMEAMIRRKDLENENLQHKLEELTGARDAQGEKLEALNWSLSQLRTENAGLTQALQQAREQLTQRDIQIQQLQADLAQTKSSLAIARTETINAEDKCAALAVAAQEKPAEEKQARKLDLTQSLKNAGSAAKKMTESLRNLAKK